LLHTAQLTLGLLIIVIPFRYRFVLIERSFPPIYNDFTGLLLYLSDIFLAATLLLWVISLLIKPRRISTGPIFLSIPLAGLLITGLFSALFSIQPTLSLFVYVRMALMGGLYLYLVNEIKSLRSILWALGAMVIIQANIGILQVLGQKSLGLVFLGELELNPSFSGISIVWMEGFRSLRAYGLSNHPNILGGLLSFALLLLAGVYIKGQSSKKVILVGVFITGLAALFLTFSLAGWMSFVIGLIAFIAFLAADRQNEAIRNMFYLMTAGFIILLPLIVHNARYLEPVLSFGPLARGEDTANNNSERAALNLAANEIFSSNALKGVGLGAFPIALKGAQPGFGYDYQPPHNILLAAAAEIGLFGALSLFFAQISPWIVLWTRRKRLSPSFDLIVVSGALAAITIVGLFDYYPWSLPAGHLWLWLLWGLWGSFYQISSREKFND